jgi:hypothetical protein
MPSVDLVDETFIVAEPAVLAQVVADRRRWATWWPELELVVFMDRGLNGIRWTVMGELVGSCEIWLEAHGDGVLLHYYLRADPTEPGSRTVPRQLPDSPRGHREMATIRRRHAIRWKQHVWQLKDELEADRPVGMPRGIG